MGATFFAFFAFFAALAVSACGTSESPSPFVREHDGGSDASQPVDDGGELPVIVDASHPEAAVPGEWGGPCLDDGQCSDAIDCTSDVCDLGRGRCHFRGEPSRCDDGVYCNGVEQCVLGLGCRPGEPVACSDGTACTIDACDESTHACTHEPRDADGDGDPDGNCPDGHDCNDQDPTVSSKATEVCANGVDDNCNGKVDEPGCKSPKYDTCASPLAITASGSYSLSPVAAALDYTASCVATNGRYHDVVANLVVPKGDGADVDVVLASGSGDSLALTASSACGMPSTEFACAASVDAPSGGSVARVALHSLAPGSTYPLTLFTDSTDPLALSVTFAPPAIAPRNETCGTAAPLVEGTHVRASLASTKRDVKSACQSALGELVYEFVLDEPRDVHVYATSLDDYGTPILSLRDAGCAELACRQADNDDLYRRALPAGRYFVTVSASGPSDVDVVLETAPPTTPPADETCSGAPPLVAGETRVVDLSRHTDDVTPGCSVGTIDAAYGLSLAEPSDVLLVAATSDADQGAVALAEPACKSDASLACNQSSSSPVRVAARAVAAGDYRVIVESALGLPVGLTALVRPTSDAILVPFADSCDGPPAEIPQGGARLQGNTANATNDYSASCDVGGSAGGRDQMLHLHLDRASRVFFDGRGSSYAAIVDVRSGATCPGNEMPSACSAGYSRDRSFLDLSLKPGDYWVQIDGYNGGSGAWVLDVYVVPGAKAEPDGG